MVASKLLNFTTTKVLDVKEGVVLEPLLNLLGEAPFPFLRKYIVPAAKRVGADLLEFAVPEVADVVIGMKNSKTAAESVGRQTLREQHGGGNQKRSIPVNNLERSSWSRKDIFSNIAN